MDKQTTAEENAGTLRGLRIQTLSLWMVAATLVVSVLIGDGIIHVMRICSSIGVSPLHPLVYLILTAPM